MAAFFSLIVWTGPGPVRVVAVCVPRLC